MFCGKVVFQWALKGGQSFTEGSAQVEVIPKEGKSGGPRTAHVDWAGDFLTIFVPDVEIGGHSGCRGRWKL